VMRAAELGLVLRVGRSERVAVDAAVRLLHVAGVSMPL
jgi:hypothetical protein